MSGVHLRTVGSAVPAHAASQAAACRFMQELAAHQLGVAGDRKQVERWQRFIATVHDRSAIDRRHAVLGDYLRRPADFTFFPSNGALEPFPSTAARMAVYEREAPALARTAAERALAAAGVAAADVSSLVVVSCTGFFAPGPDIALVRALGLRPDVERAVIGFMGCYAAFNGLRHALASCRADPSAAVLVVCVELCSLHFQREVTANNVVANALFADGAAAALVTGAGHPKGGLVIVDSYASLVAGAESLLGWTIGDTGFQMTVDPALPGALRDSAGGHVDRALGRVGAKRADVGRWAVHPGGRRILDAVGAHLGLDPDPDEGELAPSYRVLRDYGNMSSPTVLFILERILEARPARDELVLALGFGPGLTADSMLLRAA